MAARVPGAVKFEPWEEELIYEAKVIALTGWTHEEYMDAPLPLVDVILQRAAAQHDYQEWQARQARLKSKR